MRLDLAENILSLDTAGFVFEGKGQGDYGEDFYIISKELEDGARMTLGVSEYQMESGNVPRIFVIKRWHWEDVGRQQLNVHMISMKSLEWAYQLFA